MVQLTSENSRPMPAESTGGLYFPTDTTREQVFQAIGQLRKGRQISDRLDVRDQRLQLHSRPMGTQRAPHARDNPKVGKVSPGSN